MLIGGFFLTEVLLFAVTASGPVKGTQQRLSELAHTIQIGDAWSFIGVFAAFVVAIQVTAWGNQQSADRIARARSSRFTAAAVFTGSITVACWVLFTIAFNTEATGEYILLTSAAVGIVFFAADGASIVLRQDRRELLRAEARRATADASSVLYREFVGLPSPFAVAVVCAVAFAIWCVLVSAVGVTGLALVDAWRGERVDANDWIAAYVSLAIVLAFVVAGSIGSVSCYVAWISRRRRSRESRRQWSTDVGYLLGSIGLTVFVAAAIVYFPIAAATQGFPWILVIGLFVTIGGPAFIPYTALVGLDCPSRKRNWWTPRGAIRVGGAAILRGYVVSQLKSIRELSVLFD